MIVKEPIIVLNEEQEAHFVENHPERPERVNFVIEYLSEIGLMGELRREDARPVRPDRLLRVHSAEYAALVARLEAEGGGNLDPDTYVVDGSYHAAMTAAGGLVDLVESIARGDVKRGFALVRPPGHHARRNGGMGFCIFNNVAIAASTAIEEFGVHRVLIVDWDVHHGNGTQEAFYGDNRILYFSTHQEKHYPGTGDYREIGTGRGEGYTLNVPLPAGAGDKAFRHVWEKVLWPAAERFVPELVLVSAGYDAHWADPLAELTLSQSGFAFIARETVKIANRFADGRIAMTLEGGYHLDALAQGVANTMLALLERDEVIDTLGLWTPVEPDVSGLISKIRAFHPLLSLEMD